MVESYSVFGQPLSLTTRSAVFLSLVVVRFMKSTLVCEITKLNLFPPLNLTYVKYGYPNVDLGLVSSYLFFFFLSFLTIMASVVRQLSVPCTSLIVATVRIYACCLYVFCTLVSSYILGDKSVFFTCLTGFIKCQLFLF